MRKIFIFDVKELEESARQDELLAGLILERQEKILRYRQQDDKIRGLAAGLLLQFGVWQAYQEMEKSGDSNPDCEAENVCRWIPISFQRIEETACQASVFCRKLAWGQNAYGKPYLEKSPIYFNLSHSAHRVICGIADQEIGVDIQRMQDGKLESIWNRFFDVREKELLRQCNDPIQQKILFYQMWARKEAYGKLTGRGLNAALSTLPDEKALGVVFDEYHNIDGYSAAACFMDQ